MQEFYIGWMDKAPRTFAQFVKKYLLLILPVIIVIAVLLGALQKKFSKGNFEFGQPTTVTGIYFNHPVPLIKVINGKDIFGNISYITIPLVGYGKHGADGIISDIEKEKNISLDQKEVSLKGTLLYNDGKTIMQVDKNDTVLVHYSGKQIASELLPQKKDLGTLSIKGEIVDSKCYFGVMKPGEGKPHRDCAIRCILGGIPPVLVVKNEKGEANYYLLVDADGAKINQSVQPFVATPVTVNANAIQYDDWIVLYVNKNAGIREISRSAFYQPGNAVACVMR
ncbi:MAG: hypothetical protein JST75_11225 [Bacteroidetes bacterium]|nr:hypothetical protein [Bacteroidota bacterium]